MMYEVGLKAVCLTVQGLSRKQRSKHS